MRSLAYVVATIAVAIPAAFTLAQECCVSCGCHTCIRKVCHVKCETKKVPKVEYSCECEDFCVPGPSLKAGYECGTPDCKGCSKCKVKWVPQCADVYTRHKLKKTTTEKEEIAYKWVVETFCEQCATRCVTSEKDLHKLQIATTEKPAASSVDGVRQVSFTAPAATPHSAPVPVNPGNVVAPFKPPQPRTTKSWFLWPFNK